MSAPRLARANRSRFFIGLGILILTVGFVAIFHSNSSQHQLDELRLMERRCEQQQEALSQQIISKSQSPHFQISSLITHLCFSLRKIHPVRAPRPPADQNRAAVSLQGTQGIPRENTARVQSQVRCIAPELHVAQEPTRWVQPEVRSAATKLQDSEVTARRFGRRVPADAGQTFGITKNNRGRTSSGRRKYDVAPATAQRRIRGAKGLVLTNLFIDFFYYYFDIFGRSVFYIISCTNWVHFVRIFLS